MWRSDEEHDFITDSMEKKRTARGAHNKVTHGGRVRFPADYMSKKELKAMNGAVNKYNLNLPMKWADFKKMPDDLKKQYILQLREQYGASDSKIAGMLGVSGWTLSHLCSELGIAIGKKGARPTLRVAQWEEFLNNSEKVGGEKMEKEISQIEPVRVAAPDLTVPKSGSLIFEGKANDALRTIQQLLMNENVRLSVMWEKLKSEVVADAE